MILSGKYILKNHLNSQGSRRGYVKDTEIRTQRLLPFPVFYYFEIQMSGECNLFNCSKGQLQNSN